MSWRLIGQPLCLGLVPIMALWCLKALLGLDHECGYVRKLLLEHQVASYRGIISQMLCYQGGALLISTIPLLHGLKGAVIDALSHCNEAQSKLKTYQGHPELGVPLGDPRDTRQRQSHYTGHMTGTKGLSLNLRFSSSLSSPTDLVVQRG
ncbi:hypothetical protein V8C34DRAFT_170426 [Trichoderma compactum]